MEHHVKCQRGYLLVITIVIVVILAFVSLVIVNIFNNKLDTSNNLFKSNEATRIALSGLEIAKRDLIVNNTSCANLNSAHNNEPLFGGTFSVTGTYHTGTTTLSSDIGSGTSSIPVSNGSVLASSGIAQIGSEYIYYSAISGNTLTGVTRGKAGSTAASHSNGATVSQNQCFISVASGVPNLTSAQSTKTELSSVVLASTSGFSINGNYPTTSTGGNVTLTGNAQIYNSGVTLNGSGYSGSTVITQGSMSIWNNASTAVNNGSGFPIDSSTRGGGLQADVIENSPSGTSVFASYFGSMTESQLSSMAQSSNNYYSSFNLYSDYSSLNNTTNGVIYIDGSMTLYGNQTLTLGSPSQPVVLYIDGSLGIHNNFNLVVNGLVFVSGSVNLTNRASLQGSGSLGVGNSLSLHNNADLALNISAGNTTMQNLYSNIIPNAGQSSYIANEVGIRSTNY